MDISCSTGFDRSATRLDTFDWAPICSAGRSSAVISGNYRVFVGNFAYSVVVDKRLVDWVVADTVEAVGLFYRAEEPIDRSNPDRNCGCIDSGTDLEIVLAGMRIAAASVERL